jgi:hypothetical protein
VQRASFRLTAAMAMLVAALVAGCGAGKTSVTTSQASGVATPTTNTYRGRDYPARFEEGFLSSCFEDSSKGQCVCELAYVEAHVTYQVVVEEFQDSTFVSSAAYQRATQTCKHA